MSVTNGQSANAANFNAAFVSKNTDDTASGSYTLANTTPASGASLTNIQRIMNSLLSVLGMTGSEVYNATKIPGVGINIPTQTITVANSQASPANFLDVSAYQMTVVRGQMKRVTATAEESTYFELIAIKRFNSAAWDLTVKANGDITTVTFSITAAGMIQYTSGTLSGSAYSGGMTLRGETFN